MSLSGHVPRCSTRGEGGRTTVGYCTRCGRVIPSGDQFCTACGKPVERPASGLPGQTRPPGRQPPPGRRGRWAIVAGVMLGAAACGVLVTVFLVRPSHPSPVRLSAGQAPASQPGGSPSAPPSSPAPASAPPSSGSPSASGSGLASAPPSASGSGLASAPPSASPSEQTAAQGLAQLLVSSVSDRSVVKAAVGDVNSCGSGLSQDAQTFQQAAAHRQQLIGQLGSLAGLSALPAQMIQDLSNAWQASRQADQDFAAWASDENSGSGCTQNDSGNASYLAANAPDNEATADKQAFVSLWNPIATQYGLATYQWDQL